jgi:hypothetical protein
VCLLPNDVDFYQDQIRTINHQRGSRKNVPHVIWCPAKFFSPGLHAKRTRDLKRWRYRSRQNLPSKAAEIS